VPIAVRSRGSSVLTVACVPTGMNTGRLHGAVPRHQRAGAGRRPSPRAERRGWEHARSVVGSPRSGR
jgi:hypothetical protein